MRLSWRLAAVQPVQQCPMTVLKPKHCALSGWGCGSRGGCPSPARLPREQIGFEGSKDASRWVPGVFRVFRVLRVLKGPFAVEINVTFSVLLTPNTVLPHRRPRLYPSGLSVPACSLADGARTLQKGEWSQFSAFLDSLPCILASNTLLSMMNPHSRPMVRCRVTAMEAFWRSSRDMCPFLRKASPSTLRFIATKNAYVRPSLSMAQLTDPRRPLKARRMAHVHNPPDGHGLNTFDYDEFYQNELQKKHQDKSYRYFNNINRLARDFPEAHMATAEDKVTVWCSNE